jgi:hypothetical protein
MTPAALSECLIATVALWIVWVERTLRHCRSRPARPCACYVAAYHIFVACVQEVHLWLAFKRFHVATVINIRNMATITQSLSVHAYDSADRLSRATAAIRPSCPLPYNQRLQTWPWSHTALCSIGRTAPVMCAVQRAHAGLRCTLHSFMQCLRSEESFGSTAAATSAPAALEYAGLSVLRINCD